MTSCSPDQKQHGTYFFGIGRLPESRPHPPHDVVDVLALVLCPAGASVALLPSGLARVTPSDNIIQRELKRKTEDQDQLEAS